jgi:serine/threonine protein phosphatase 1
MGIDATLKSYGVHTAFSLQSLDFLPAPHLEFLKSLRLYWETGEYIFVHAGLDPNLALGAQDATSFCEVRDSFISGNFNLGKRVIFGHTEFELPLVTARMIGIDTGAVHGNLLTAVELPGATFHHA